MFRSHKDRRQVCMLLHVNCYTVGTLIMRYVLNSFFTTCTKVITFIVLKFKTLESLKLKDRVLWRLS
jgi:hypothetical protein